MEDFTFRSIYEHHTALSRGFYSARALVEHFLARIQKFDARLNSFLTVVAERALAEADQADVRLAAGDRAPLLGIPLVLKDNFETAGIRTTAGSRVLEDWVPAQDAPTVKALRRAGAIILGKTQLSEFASGPNVFGPMRNPWNLQRTAGGSSGGTASAVAAGLAVAGTGTDTGGSIRIPSAFCGLTGLKPTYGRVSIRGIQPAAWSLDHAGPIARSAQDVAELMNVLVARDPLDPTQARIPAEDFLDQIIRGPSGLRIGRVRAWFSKDVDGSVLRPVEAALEEFSRAGCTLHDLKFPLAEQAMAIHNLIMRVEVSAFHDQRLFDRGIPYGPGFRLRYIAAGLLPATDYMRAQKARSHFCRALASAMASVDLLATPTVRLLPPKLDPNFSGDYRVNGRKIADRTYALAGLTAPFNLSGYPSITFPCGFAPNGLPVGLQLVAKPFQEPLLLQAAAAYQRRTNWHLQHPPKFTPPLMDPLR